MYEGGNREMTTEQRIAQLEQELHDIQARLPRHSTPPAMLLRLEEVEEELAVLKAQTPHERPTERQV
jgi:hypothetical protein